jgi:hypothetical protein
MPLSDHERAYGVTRPDPGDLGYWCQRHEWRGEGPAPFVGFHEVREPLPGGGFRLWQIHERCPKCQGDPLCMPVLGIPLPDEPTGIVWTPVEPPVAPRNQIQLAEDILERQAEKWFEEHKDDPFVRYIFDHITPDERNRWHQSSAREKREMIEKASVGRLNELHVRESESPKRTYRRWAGRFAGIGGTGSRGTGTIVTADMLPHPMKAGDR